MQEPVNPINDVTSFRLGELERGFREIRGDLKEAVGTLGGGMTALQTQLSSYQTTMGDRFVPRRDFEARQREIDERFKELAIQRDQAANRWPMWISAVCAGLSVMALYFTVFHPMH